MESDLSIREMTTITMDQPFLGLNAILLILIGGGLIFGFFYLIRNYLFPLIESERTLLSVKSLSFRIEVIAWSAFTLLILIYLLMRNPTVAAVILILIGLVGLSFWRDFFPGLFFRLSQFYMIGDTVTFDAVKGRIEKIGLTTVQLRTERDELLFVPYNKIVKDVHAKQQAKGKLLSAKIILPIESNDPVEIENRIEIWLRNCPWAVPQKEMAINLTEPGKVALTIYAIDSLSLSRTEAYLMKKVLT